MEYITLLLGLQVAMWVLCKVLAVDWHFGGAKKRGAASVGNGNDRIY